MTKNATNRKTAEFRSGYVSLTGRPNVGKSTLLNTILGQKISIVTSRPQTTRNRIIGIKTLSDAQVVLVDTPGIHRPKHGLGAHMVKEAKQAIKDVDVILFMVEPRLPSAMDASIITQFKHLRKPVCLLINKTDKVKKHVLLPIIDEYRKLYPFEEIFPISALKGEGIEDMFNRVVELLPPGPKYYPDDLFTDSLERFMVSEMIREKVMDATVEEIPHATAVDIAEWKEEGEGPIFISANIFVEKNSQKGIIIGNKGSRIKAIGTAARLDIESLLGAKVYLELFVKVRKHWRTDKTILSDLGFNK